VRQGQHQEAAEEEGEIETQEGQAEEEGMSSVATRREFLDAVDGRRSEIVEAVFARVQAIGGRSPNPDPAYLEGLRLAVEAAIDHTIEAFGREADWPLSLPDQVLAQARLAARRRVPLETVLRRYQAGHSVLGDFMVEEASRRGISSVGLRRMLRSSAAETDRVLAAISSAYAAEIEAPRPPSGEQRRAESVRRLLDGELIDQGRLGYELDNVHVGVVIRGQEARKAVADLASVLGAARLMVAGDDDLLWAWIGRHDGLEPDPLKATLVGSLPPGSRLGIGEPARGRAGWRLSHDQARAAMTVADRSSEHALRYSEVAVLASAISDELLTTSLQALYLDPLADDRADAGTLRETLRAYLETGGSATSTAAALGVSRNTVSNRLRTVEEKIGHLRPSRIADLALALRLDQLRTPVRPK
jgi:DNA-binding CsgD family transcriptional regulator